MCQINTLFTLNLHNIMCQLYLFLFFFFFATPRSLRDLSFPTGGRTQAPSSESMESPSPKHWTAREFPIISKKKYIFQKIMFVKVPSRVSGINIISFPFLN